jgi:hypothetical protein
VVERGVTAHYHGKGDMGKKVKKRDKKEKKLD